MIGRVGHRFRPWRPERYEVSILQHSLWRTLARNRTHRSPHSIELKLEIEELLEQEAAAKEVSVESYVEELIEQQVS